LNAANLEAAVKTIAGSARSMGLNVEDYNGQVIKKSETY